MAMTANDCSECELMSHFGLWFGKQIPYSTLRFEYICIEYISVKLGHKSFHTSKFANCLLFKDKKMFIYDFHLYDLIK